MDPSELADAVTLVLGFFAPYLLGESPQGGEEACAQYGTDAWLVATELWSRLQPPLETRPATLEAVRNVAQSPGEDTMAVLREALGALLDEDWVLRTDLSSLIASSAYASLAGMPHTRGVRGQMTFAELKIERLTYAAILLAAWVAIGIAAYIFQSLILVAVALLVRGALTVRSARRVSMSGHWWLGAATLIPGGAWITLFGILSFRPPQLTPQTMAARGTPERGELEPWVRWVTPAAFLPLVLAAFLIRSESNLYATTLRPSTWMDILAHSVLG